MLQLNVPDEELVHRRAVWQPPAPRYARGVLAAESDRLLRLATASPTSPGVSP